MNATTESKRPVRDFDERLRAADRRHQRHAGLRFLFRAAPWVLGALLLSFVVDVVAHLSGGARLGIALAWGVGVLATLAVGHWIAWHRRNRPEFVARLLESREPALGSSLINFLQLRRQFEAEERSPVTRALAEEAVAEYKARFAGIDLAALGAVEPPRRERKRAWIALGIFAGILLVTFPVAKLELARFFDPLGDHPPFSFTRLEIAGEELRVIYGEAATISVEVGGHRPEELFVSFFDPAKPDEVTTLPMFDKGEQGFLQQIENIRSNLTVYAHTRDRASESRRMRLEVVLTPKIERAFVQIFPPEYAGVASEEKPFDFKSVQALRGSRVRFRLASNRPLRGGAITFVGTTGEPGEIALTKSADHEVAGEIVAKETGTLQFSVADVDGLPSRENPTAPLTVTLDLAPDIRIENPPADAFVSEDFTVECQVGASDDYGIRTLRIHRALNGIYSAPLVREYAGPPRRQTEKFELVIPELGVQPGDILTIFAEAIDTHPDSHLSTSQTVNLMIISVEEYNNYLRERSDLGDLEAKFQRLTSELGEKIEAQQRLAEKMALAAETLDPETLEKLAEEQSKLNADLEALAERMKNFTREKPLYDIEHELQEALNRQAERLRNSSAQSQQDVEQARGAGSPGAQLARLEEGAREQLERLGAASEHARREIMEPIADTRPMDELLKDMNYFKQLYETQKAVTQQTAAMGSGRKLTREDEIALKNLAATEQRIQAELERLAEKLKADAEAAEANFPKAAQSGRDLAEGIRAARLPGLANVASRTMLNGDGAKSHAMAEGLREAMERFFSQCNSNQQGMAGELDQYLQLQRGMNPGNTFQQMMMSRKFGMGSGQGSSAAGMGGFGYASSIGPNFGVMGGETMGGDGASSDPRAGGPGAETHCFAGDEDGRNAAGRDAADDAEYQTEAVQTETSIDEYRAVVDAYFDSITK